jgi:hypothetical protein
VHDERVASRERQQLVLAATIHAQYPCAAKTRDRTRRKMTPLRAMKSADVSHSLSDDGVPQNASGMLDLGQFRHFPSR